MESLATFLGVQLPDPAAAPPADGPAFEELVDVSDPQKFCQGIVASREFRQYILTGILLGGKDGLPPAVMCRIIDHAWGKPVERVEHSGKDGAPIVTEIRRIIVRPNEVYDDEAAVARPAVTH